MALSGLDIYKLLPKTNCKECGLATCLAFAMQIAKKALPIEKCPYISSESKAMLEASTQPPIKLVSIGTGETKFEAGNETVLFRHEEKFHRPCGIGFIIEDSESESVIKEKVDRINKLSFERVGQKLNVNLVALRQTKDKDRFLKALNLIARATPLGIVLMTNEPETLTAALLLTKDKKPLVFPKDATKSVELSKIARDSGSAVVASAPDLDKLSMLTLELNKAGIGDILLDTGKKSTAEKLWDLTQIRRLALKKSNRSLGYTTIVIVDRDDPIEEAIEATTFIAKYAGIVLIKSIESWQTLALLTLRQNIYTDPQKPLQIEPKLYPIGQVNDKSPVLITTNFSLSYYTVLGEVEASKIPSYIMSVDTEGMSVLTAWAAEKFTPDRITSTIAKYKVESVVKHKSIVIPGYVAVMSGDLEEQSGWKVVVGPKEASGIPSFLKNL
jgi:acetyl-CoA decarbonylase/synthase complex subunit gamma